MPILQRIHWSNIACSLQGQHFVCKLDTSQHFDVFGLARLVTQGDYQFKSSFRGRPMRYFRGKPARYMHHLLWLLVTKPLATVLSPRDHRCSDAVPDYRGERLLSRVALSLIPNLLLDYNIGSSRKSLARRARV